MRFNAYRSDVAALDAARGIPAVERILWFDHGFAKAEVRDGTLVLSDLRMGSEPDYSFNFAVARRENGKWIALDPPRQPRFEWKMRRGWGDLWNRIWRQPPAGI